MMASRTLAVCADDFGTSPGISRAIAALVEAGRLQAVSCLTTHAGWPAAAALARGWSSGVDVGLHLNLSEGAPLSDALRAVWPVFPALPTLIVQAYLRRLPLAAIAAELRAQLDAFTAARGRAPDFIDGHQHVHALPGVRELVLDAACAAAPPLALRNTARVRGAGFAVKRRVIEATGGAAALRAMRRRSVPHNAVLVGVYDFADPDYRALVRRWLRAVPADGALLFSHPGAADAPGDPIAAARVREAAYLASDAFAADLRDAGVALGRVWRV